MELTPFLKSMYEDNHPNIMVVAGRQTFKTTFCTDLLGCYAITHPRHESCYVADSEAHLSAFSRQRFRNEFFLQNPLPRQFLIHDRGNIGQIALANDHNVYLVTDEGEYKKVEGKSLQLLVLDEMQYQDVQYIQKAMYALWRTHGRFYGLGIGGEAGSEYHKMWLRTDQREWVYDDKLWREKLTFDSIGNISNDDDKLRGILSGRWVPRAPENTQYRGYHLPQHIYAQTPVSIHDAIHKYRIAQDFSIEHQQKYAPKSIYISHSLGEFYKAERRPITPDMIREVMDKSLRFLRAEEVIELKSIYGNEIRVTGGIDFGSSSVTPTTVLSINIKWRKSNRTQIAYMEKIPQDDHPMDKARHVVDLFRGYGCDFSVGDWGHGQDMIPFIQQGGRDSNDVSFQGLTRAKFMGCRTIGDPTKPLVDYKEDVSDDGVRTLAKITIDKTTTIQAFIDLFGQYVAHPKYPDREQLKRPVYMIPAEFDYETDYLIDEWTKLTRVDLEENQEDIVEDKRQNVLKQFSHPPDSLMSQIYCFVADRNWQPEQRTITGVRKRR